MQYFTKHLIVAGAIISLFVAPALTRAADVATVAKPASREQIVKSGVEFLKKAQKEDGSYSPEASPGITAICATALLRSGVEASDPAVDKALKYLQKFVRDDGGIYGEGSRWKNYETSIAIVTFHEANKNGEYDKLLADAEKFVKKEQWDEDEKQTPSDVTYGGAGYGSKSRPDLSNTSFLLDALHSLGRGEDDPAVKKALIFVSRCQNLESQYNTTPFAAKVKDGGFYYTPAGGGGSEAGQTADGGLRSYGSMTYAGLKSMIFAGVNRDDPRTKAAHKWIQDHYTLDENPGMGDNGTYYYLHTFAKALNAMGDDAFVDKDGKSHDWRAELVAKLAELQKKEGNWVNSNARWLEGDANLVTAYSLLALAYCNSEKVANVTPPLDNIVPPPGDDRN